MKTKVKYEDVVEALSAIDDYATDVDYEYGLPLHGSFVEDMVQVLLEKLGLALDEDPKIVAIMKHTGCSREQALSLINSGELK